MQVHLCKWERTLLKAQDNSSRMTIVVTQSNGPETASSLKRNIIIRFGDRHSAMSTLQTARPRPLVCPWKAATWRPRAPISRARTPIMVFAADKVVWVSTNNKVRHAICQHLQCASRYKRRTIHIIQED